jgi:hypothetical protein
MPFGRPKDVGFAASGELGLRVYWEQIGVLGPIYRLVGKGLNDLEIADILNIPEVKVRDCISWMLKSFDMSDRLDLVRRSALSS